MVNTEVPPNGTRRTWYLPLATRIVIAIGWFIICLIIPALWLLLTFAENQAPSDHWWIALAVFAAAWCLLAWRICTQSVTLTWDTLVIRNFFETQEIPFTSIARVSFRRGRLSVTPRRGARSRERITINAAPLGPSYWTGRRSTPDEIADAITSAAALPPLPPRKEIITPTWSWILLLASAACLALGIYWGPLEGSNTHSSLLGALLYGIGIGTVGHATAVTIDHYRKRRPGH